MCSNYVHVHIIYVLIPFSIMQLLYRKVLMPIFDPDYITVEESVFLSSSLPAL